MAGCKKCRPEKSLSEIQNFHRKLRILHSQKVQPIIKKVVLPEPKIKKSL